MDNIFRIYLFITVLALAACIISSIFKKTKLLIVLGIIFIVLSLKTGAIALALGYEAPEQRDIDMEKPDERPYLKIGLPTVDYYYNPDRIGFGLDGNVDPNHSSKSSNNAVTSEDIKNTISDAIKNVVGSSSDSNDTSDKTETVNTETSSDETSIDNSALEETNTSDDKVASNEDEGSASEANESDSPIDSSDDTENNSNTEVINATE